MTAEEQKVALEGELVMRRAYQEVFCRTPNGSVVLTDILNELRYFATDASEINPVCIAAANLILWKSGVYSRDGDHLIKQMEALTRQSTTRDLEVVLSELGTEEGK